ncbi:hypothetical protein JCGZ_26787 [Jatropha curcas]|uniref:Uncharacterized protein n=2 Tax=Jatropha curcas TaxID=180498 RepID=A0A067LCH5_JATCU|nr:hypothetical protein JCGZ_26787 [Jatropha curcas]
MAATKAFLVFESSFDNIKLKKANALKKHRQLQKIANFFRFIEVCIVLALISRFSIRLPVAVKNSSEYFKDLTVILVSPRFVFVLGNVIVITLFAKSGQFSSQDSTGKNSRTDIYEEFLQKSERSHGMHLYEPQNKAKQSINRGKQGACVQHTVTGEETRAALEIKNYQRSQSEKLLIKANPNKSCRELRRSATEKFKENVESSEGWVKISYPEDSMSNEEFRCTVEAFIARQKRFRRDEETYVLE